MSILAVANKIKFKFQEKGPVGFFIVVFGKIQRTYRRRYFQLIGHFLESRGMFRYSHKFELLPLDVGNLSTFPAEKVFQQVHDNLYQILEGTLRDWGRTGAAGQLHWHRDLVQNFGWSAEKLGIELSIPLDSGDIKRPWEIGRLHQLVQLALCYSSFEQADKKKQCMQLATDILKDFHLMNPKFLGPQWMCAMDVGIRLSNICLAADIFGAEFVLANQDLLDYELARHIFFIEYNRENSWGSTVANHYYANLCGLIFGYAHCSQRKYLSHLKSVAQTMEKETMRQFGQDGGNFEGSTYYHRLSGELALFSFACLAKKIKIERVLRPSLWQRLERIGVFSEAISQENAFVPQIGDNDSGHLFIFDPLQFQKNDLNHCGLRRGLRRFKQVENKSQVLELLIDDFLNTSNDLASSVRSFETWGDENAFLAAKDIGASMKNAREYAFRAPHLLASESSTFIFPQFGLYVYKNKDFYFYVRCGVNAEDKGGGHRHRDQLSICIFDGIDVVGRDPGTYVYTSNSAQRNKLRSSSMHNGPYCGSGLRKEKSLFEMEDQAATCFYFGKLGFFGKSFENGRAFNRLISFTGEVVEVLDWTDDDAELTLLDFTEKVYSRRYGHLEGFGE